MAALVRAAGDQQAQLQEAPCGVATFDPQPRSRFPLPSSRKRLKLFKIKFTL